MRPTVFFVVLALHLAILALLLLSRSQARVDTGHPVELVYLAPLKPPKMRVENARPERLSTNIAVALASPQFNSSLQTGSSSAPDGRGAAVNWIAEAHRAVRAFEIRRNQTQNRALSVSSALDESGAREHHAGDQSKTAEGDWIVWINADCYQIASWGSGAAALTALAPQTICRNQSAKPH